MLRRVGVAISVGLADSLNPSTVGPALYLATVRKRVWRVTQFTIGVFSVTFAGGLVLTIGPGRFLLGLVQSDGGHLFLGGVGPELLEQLRPTHRVDLQDAVTVIPASETILESTQKAYDDAEEWLTVHAS